MSAEPLDVPSEAGPGSAAQAARGAEPRSRYLDIACAVELGVVTALLEAGIGLDGDARDRMEVAAESLREYLARIDQSSTEAVPSSSEGSVNPGGDGSLPESAAIGSAAGSGLFNVEAWVAGPDGALRDTWARTVKPDGRFIVWIEGIRVLDVGAADIQRAFALRRRSDFPPGNDAPGLV